MMRTTFKLQHTDVISGSCLKCHSSLDKQKGILFFITFMLFQGGDDSKMLCLLFHETYRE